ncbi:MAG: hypothetical protein ACOX6V_05245 [Patescibacteria group bacterium]|jgi:hypothetical protein
MDYHAPTGTAVPSQVKYKQDSFSSDENVVDQPSSNLNSPEFLQKTSPPADESALVTDESSPPYSPSNVDHLEPTQPLTYTSESVNVHEDPVTVKSPSPLSGLVKLLFLTLVPLGLTITVAMVILKQNEKETYLKENNVVLTVPMQNVNWQDLGTVFEPVISIPVKTQSGYEKWEFLLDSGAVISSLPREWAEKTGQNLAFLKRSTFRGFGGKTSFAYQGEMMVLLGEDDKKVPVVFTEASGTKSLLGRKGFFENYSIYFNHKEKQIEIRQ